MSVTVGAVASVAKKVAGTDELGTARAFALLAGGVLGAVANFGAVCGTECSLSWSSSGPHPACGG